MAEAGGMRIFMRRAIFYSLVGSSVIYSFFIYTSATAPGVDGAVLTAEGRRGKLLFQEHNCIACHQLFGLGGYMGPDLTNVISTPGKGKDYAEVFLRYGTNKMPNFRLSEKEISELIAFLTFSDQTGISPPYNAHVNKDGSVSLPGNK